MARIDLDETRMMPGKFRGHGLLWWAGMALLALFLGFGLFGCVYAMAQYG